MDAARTYTWTAMTMQSSTADANCYDFIGNGRKREKRPRR